MKYPRWLTVLALITIPVLLFSIVMQLPSLSESARDGLFFGILIDAVVQMLTIAALGLRVWKHQAAVDVAVARETADIEEMVSYKRFVLGGVGLSVYVAIPILTAILFSVGT